MDHGSFRDEDHLDDEPASKKKQKHPFLLTSILFALAVLSFIVIPDNPHSYWPAIKMSVVGLLLFCATLTFVLVTISNVKDRNTKQASHCKIGYEWIDAILADPDNKEAIDKHIELLPFRRGTLGCCKDGTYFVGISVFEVHLWAVNIHPPRAYQVRPYSLKLPTDESNPSDNTDTASQEKNNGNSEDKKPDDRPIRVLMWMEPPAPMIEISEEEWKRVAPLFTAVPERYVRTVGQCLYGNQNKPD